MSLTSQYIERYGHLTKYETLRTLSTTKIPGTLVLEAPEPFPGYLEYYSERPHFSSPLYVYLVVHGRSSLEEVVRATQLARKLYDKPFEAAYTIVRFPNETLEAIRIRKLENFSQIPELQEAFSKSGIVFAKPTKDHNERALLTIKKLFHLNSIGDDMYLDRGEPEQGYFSLPFQVNWDGFRDLVKRVRYNWNTSKSDFALGLFYTNDRIQDVVRVYHPEINIELLSEARRQFLNRI